MGLLSCNSLMQRTKGRNTKAPARILLLGSHQGGLKARKAYLEEQGHEVLPCSKVKDANAHLANAGVSLLICDYKLDQQNGVDFLHDTRAQHATLPTILLLNQVEEMSVNREDCCADLVVSKHFNELAHLARSVERLLSRKAPRKKPTAIRKTASPAARASGKD